MSAPSETLVCPPPQADRISVVAAVVDAIAAGCTTAESIADAIDMSGRQGSYYPSAAWRLGFVEPDRSTSPITWTLTDLGEQLVSGTVDDRIDLLIAALLELDDLETYMTSAGTHELTAQWSDGYSPETVTRRLQTIAAWSQFLTADLDDQRTAIGSAIEVTRNRAPHAKLRADAHAVAVAVSRPKAQPVLYGGVCPSCFMTTPLSGVCPTCD